MISQKTYAEALADEYLRSDVGKKNFPLSTGIKFEEFDIVEPATNILFRELVGSLMWLATQTGPDKSDAVCAVVGYAPHQNLFTGRRP